MATTMTVSPRNHDNKNNNNNNNNNNMRQCEWPATRQHDNGNDDDAQHEANEGCPWRQRMTQL